MMYTSNSIVIINFDVFGMFFSYRVIYIYMSAHSACKIHFMYIHVYYVYSMYVIVYFCSGLQIYQALLTINLSIDLSIRTQNSKIQNGRPEFKKIVDSDRTQQLRVFGVTDYKCELKIQKSLMAILDLVQYRGPKFIHHIQSPI